ncbi:hybrid sensor histidine kinase/response regulator [Desulfopila aestuarii]|uniref:histidine kinase n=1 Tax=Desulfopila aestuarii DSM 18488 TaxID=1121416 RepID=A0A1M7XWH2_9BACT|nr:PAS domain-containing sensor histidine kinase [Desulfopila aestuarii]SHO43085.1 PAS domain S-box-containing protein [Desulfopila aestuarii DSM 18488]
MQLPLFARYRQFVIISLVFATLFAVSAVAYYKYQQTLDRKTLSNHARIIADDVWAINPAGVENYLRLAMETQHYKSISVSIPGNDHFITLQSPEMTGLAGFLSRTGLIWTKELSKDITHKDLHIGKMQVIQYVQLIFPLLNLLAFYLLLFLLTLFILFLSNRKRTLESLVRERTHSLLESQRRFHDLVNLLPEMVLETNIDGSIRYANSEARKRFGISHENSDGCNLFDFFPADTRQSAQDQFRRNLEQGTLYQDILHDKDHHAFPVLLRSAPIVDASGCIGARLLLIDITERQRMEEQLNRDHKMKAIGLMAGGVAHDLNNILSGIVSYPELLMLDMTEENPLRRPLSIIRKAGLDASEVVADLLTVARGSRGDLEIIDLNVLIQDYLDSPDFEDMRRRFPLVEHSFIPASDLMFLSCSPIHVRKCLMNLVINGFEAIEGKGSIRIVTENVNTTDLQTTHPGLPNDKRYIRITVSDTGKGIEEKELEHIFEPFYSKKVMGRSGTGLGLTVVYNTVRDHDGATRVTSSELGTTFELLFPGTSNAVPLKGKNHLQVLKGNGETVLVIDDEPRQREIATTLLRSLGYQVTTASTGKEAWRYLEKNPADLVVLDMLMGPNQPNGKEIYQQILTINPGQKAIIASGYAEDDDVRETLTMGATAFVPKPYTMNSISRAVYDTLRAPARQHDMAS